MKTKYIKYLTCSLGVAFSFYSCTDSFLDKDPDERVEIKKKKHVVALHPTGY